MSAAAVAELEANLQAMLSMKPPGVSASKIGSLTKLCVENVQYESVLVQKMYTHFMKTPPTHKLGVLYVVDSVTRKWMEQARIQGQLPISISSPDGTFAAGVHRVTELMPVFMEDIIQKASDQKEKIKKLVEIWERGETFPISMLNNFKEKLRSAGSNSRFCQHTGLAHLSKETRTEISADMDAHQSNTYFFTLDGSTTPTDSPPPYLYEEYRNAPHGASGATRTAPPPPNPTTVLEQLKQLASFVQGQPAPAPAAAAPVPIQAPVLTSTPNFPPTAPPTFASMYGQTAIPASNGVQSQHALPYLTTSQPPSQPVNQPGMPFPYTQPAAVAAAPQATPTPGLNGSSNPPPDNTTLQIVSALLAQNIPVDRIASVIQMMGQGGAAAQPPPQQIPQPPQVGFAVPPVGGMAGSAPWEPPRPDDSRDRMMYHNGMRSPNRPRGRSRSRSPARWDTRDSPRSRRNERGFDYGRTGSPDRGQELDGARGRIPDYRQRSPAGRHGQSPPVRDFPQEEKWVDFDPNIPDNHIKVKSRTLFVGGVNCSEAELNDIFSQYGQVQSCIVNKDKRHAFVKMYFRRDAERAKAAMEEARTGDLQLRTRWGVGFGPRDCSDYQVGISIIPIQKLTDADKKWMLTAPYGGSGGRPIRSGMCVEEPDIEIGAGVSSKAISRRMQTDKGGNHGPKSSRRDDDFGHSNGPPGGGGNAGGGGGSGGRWRNKDKHRGSQDSHHHNKRGDNHNRDHGVEDPIVMGLPQGFIMGPNGPQYPSGGYQYGA
ncbi:Rpb7-binding protein seb1 [Podospora fimiseda]|uniref:Rpb7-binding protein seb1 n=1 Tax=Podospora fimiseda TaxID=252190 RepID=A0AAN6YNA4_9PEZI|nr:Rpb7-binding protein seb1 [Podospora fimiseda]